MLDIAQRVVAEFSEQAFQPRFARGEGQRAQVFALRKQQVEGEENQRFGFAVRQRGLQRREVRRAIVVERADFAVDDAIGQLGGDLGDGGKLVGPVQPLAGEDLALPFSTRNCMR